MRKGGRRSLFKQFKTNRRKKRGEDGDEKETEDQICSLRAFIRKTNVRRRRRGVTAGRERMC
jgi:hypothetical protein